MYGYLCSLYIFTNLKQMLKNLKCVTFAKDL